LTWKWKGNRRRSRKWKWRRTKTLWGNQWVLRERRRKRRLRQQIWEAALVGEVV
jgi:hypothetical protein